MKVLLLTDITNFYGSIYTHSIPWALHTKSVAKSRRSDFTLIGNQLDRLIQRGQDDQTNGIPIGPDTSLLIAEILMQSCDSKLQSHINNLRGFRLIDDYELAFRSWGEAEDALGILQECLREYELELNHKKTRILDLPQTTQPIWLTKLKSMNIRKDTSSQKIDGIALVEEAIQLSSEFEGESVLSYAISKLKGHRFARVNFKTIQELTMLCVSPEPSCFPYALDLMVKFANAGHSIDKESLEEFVMSHLLEHSKRFQSSEVANALWASIVFKMTIPETVARALSHFDNPVVALLVLHAEELGLIPNGLDKSVWCTHMNQESLYDEFWLLAYEAYVKGWLPSQDGTDYIARDLDFSFLKRNSVEFYDKGTITIEAGEKLPSPTLPTSSKSKNFEMMTSG